METIDPSLMRRIEKAVQLEKAFVEADWEGRLSTTEATRIEPTEKPVIQFNNQWNLGLEGEIEFLGSSADGPSHSCKISLRLARKGTLADAKSPNFGSRLAMRSRLVSGVFELTEGRHTLLAALPQTLSDQDSHTLLFILTLGNPGASTPASPHHNGPVTIETYRMAMDDWHRIPETIRDDHRQLYEKCRVAAGKGKIERIDRLSTCATSKDKNMNCMSVVEMSYPTSFGVRNRVPRPERWVYRNAGSSLEAFVNAATNDIGINYEMMPELPVWHPTLADGTAQEVALYRMPAFDGFRFSGAFTVGTSARTCLLGVIPLPAGGDPSTRIALMFASVAGRQKPVPEAMSDVMVEVLVARGPSVAGPGTADERIRSLLGRPGSIESVAAATVLSGQRSVVSSATEWIGPNSPRIVADTMVIPSFEILDQGTNLDVVYERSSGSGPIPITLRFKHDLRKMVLSLATHRLKTRGTSYRTLERDVAYKLEVSEKLELTLGEWTFIKEIPLEAILGADDKTAQGQSCHVFARLIRSVPTE
ncbi:MAG: hypothetical protein KDN05_11985 [Verrucomicrobiae bacterium]|nr:hypothetical protein [Verrucomicrobiae bacterium]